jgi:hypothetical protein
MGKPTETALELAANHLGLLKKKLEHSGEIDLVARLGTSRPVSPLMLPCRAGAPPAVRPA